ncbi:protein CASPARIAN STRIP INTEGRITY FACTOR 1-like [Dioscorea cayenensis subsp. rotundata]|uniref:Protein CASPARIAN STRIP INTEGRITY FACTOR 1-like n=1 Tax=Dioscorea cayennensis subsp. rotundata TaxID=55577 RepID=A0AB40CW80_DIOCR|nr:protein CASPARIAN STRIP INTEGRITY FACTOR 1-like [Dioscorea cayenensis subsp. rotundata]
MMMPSERSTSTLLLLILISASLFSASFAGEHRKLLHRSAPTLFANAFKHEYSSRKFRDEEQQILLPRSRILVVKTNDYGNYEPTPALTKPPFKLIPN